MIEVTKVKQKRPNLFMSDNEAKILWTYSKRWSNKFRMMLAFAMFRGLRIGEICAISILDFEEDFTKLRVTFEKSHIQDTLPLIPELTAMVKEYILTNHHMFHDGYLFPYYNSRKRAKYMHIGVAEALFSKLRKIIGKYHPGFLERTVLKSGQFRYRIGWHTCRRFFETKIYEAYKDRKGLADIMRYIDVSTVDVYIDSYSVWKTEKLLLERVFSDRMIVLDKCQTKISEWRK